MFTSETALMATGAWLLTLLSLHILTNDWLQYMGLLNVLSSIFSSATGRLEIVKTRDVSLLRSWRYP